jgi:hypothetical protein
VPLVPTGGVNLDTAADYIRAGAAALGVGGELILKHAFQEGKPELISNLAMRYAELVKEARNSVAGKSDRTAEAHRTGATKWKRTAIAFEGNLLTILCSARKSLSLQARTGRKQAKESHPESGLTG